MGGPQPWATGASAHPLAGVSFLEAEEGTREDRVRAGVFAWVATWRSADMEPGQPSVAGAGSIP